MSTRKEWKFASKNPFDRNYRSLDPKIKEKVNLAIRELLASGNPAYLGTYKTGMRMFAYKIDRRYRPIHNVNRNNGTVQFIRVCDHESAYLKD